MWQWILYKNIQLLLLDALLNTLRAFAVAAVLALVFGAVFAAGRLSDHRWIRQSPRGEHGAEHQREHAATANARQRVEQPSSSSSWMFLYRIHSQMSGSNCPVTTKR